MLCNNSNEHLEVVRYLHSIGAKENRTSAMDCASNSGHLEVVKFLKTI
jgi:hypothetical protein